MGKALFVIVFLVAICLLSDIASVFYEIAAKKGFKERRFFWWTFFLPPIGMMMVVDLPDRGVKEPAFVENNPVVRCEACGYINKSDYSFCRSCGKPR